MTFEPEDTIIEIWGKLQIVINDIDVTFFRDVPTIVSSVMNREPFGDASCTLSFPGITPFESELNFPFREFQTVEINRLTAEGIFVETLFEGLVGSYDDSLSETEAGITIECIGALYQADFYLRAPAFNDYPFDIATGIAAELNTRSRHYGLRLQEMDTNVYVNVSSKSRGSWNPVLTGWIQDLLANSWSDGFMLDGEEAVALSQTFGTLSDGLLVTGHFGTNLSLGQRIPFYGSSSYLTRYIAALYSDEGRYIRDMATRPQHDGQWVMDRNGKIICYGEAPFFGDHEGDNVAAWAITPTSTGEGYWTLQSNGVVTAFGDAVHYGDQPSLAAYNGFDDAAIDFAVLPDDTGYYILTRVGRVHAYGAAPVLSYQLMTDQFYSCMSVTPDGLGYYTVDTLGRVNSEGTAVHYGDATSPDHWIVDIAVNITGEGYALLADSGKIHYFGDFRDVGTVEWSVFADHGANVYQWTLTKETGRKPVMKVKDNWTTHWTYTVGQPGVTHDLQRDYMWAPNVYFGEGIDPENCRWRNSKYPNIHPDSAPIWPGYNINVHENNSGVGVTLWQQRMADSGWWITVDGTYDQHDADVCRRFQEQAGIIVDGVVGPQTWASTFGVGENTGNLNAAYFAPLAQRAWVEPFTYDASGAITGTNPWWDKSYIRIEHYDNYGEHVTKQEATISAQARLRSQSGPNFVGRFTFKTDPEEGHRFNIKAGENILYKGYRGFDVLFHVAEVTYDYESLTTSVTVDTAFRDASTISQIMARNRDLNNPSMTPTRHQSASRIVEDRISVWDCDSGAGIIPRMGIGQDVWQVIRIPAGEFGQIVSTTVNTDIPAEMSVAVFDRPITANTLQQRGHPMDELYWSDFPDDIGLVIAWGGEQRMAGYYPGSGQEDGAVPTGVFVDRGAWNYWSTNPPWIWVALFCSETTYIQGRMFPGMEGTGFIPDFVGVAEPTGLI